MTDRVAARRRRHARDPEGRGRQQAPGLSTGTRALDLRDGIGSPSYRCKSGGWRGGLGTRWENWYLFESERLWRGGEKGRSGKGRLDSKLSVDSRK